MIKNLISKYIGILFFHLRNTKLYDYAYNLVFPFIIKNISRYFKDTIDEKLIVLGAYSGRVFTDNSKYIFDFLHNNSDYEVVWIAKKLKDVFLRLRQNGYNVINMYSIRAIKTLRKAKYIFATHGYSDVLPIKFSSKTEFILLWHGTPLKKINIGLEDSLIYSRLSDYFRLELKFHQYVDYLLTATRNQEEFNILSLSFKIPRNRIINLGYPRNDIFFKDKGQLYKKLRNEYEIPEKIKRIILYAPTFREDHILKFPIDNDELKKLNEFLIESSCIILLKGHMFERKTIIKEFSNIRLMDTDGDVQELAFISDALITDYSSIMFDYLLLDRPILLFVYDLDDYTKRRGMYYNFKEIAPGPLLFTGRELIDAIIDLKKINAQFKERRRNIRERFNKYIDGNSTHRILDFLNINYYLDKKN